MFIIAIIFSTLYKFMFLYINVFLYRVNKILNSIILFIIIIIIIINY